MYFFMRKITKPSLEEIHVAPCKTNITLSGAHHQHRLAQISSFAIVLSVKLASDQFVGLLIYIYIICGSKSAGSLKKPLTCAYG